MRGRHRPGPACRQRTAWLPALKARAHRSPGPTRSALVTSGCFQLCVGEGIETGGHRNWGAPDNFSLRKQPEAGSPI